MSGHRPGAPGAPRPDAAALDAAFAALTRALPPSQVAREAPLARLTTLRVGGAAALLVRPERPEAVATALGALEAAGVPWSPLGLGSNVVVDDAGYGGCVLRLAGALTGAARAQAPAGAPLGPDEALFTFGAGVANAHAVRDLHADGWVGAECVALVPGTLGGAVAMNAGTRWGELSACLDAAEVALASGEVRWIAADALAMRYRTTRLPPGAVVTRARLRVRRGDVAAAREAIAHDKRYRARTQPFKQATSGSIFRNPPGDSAGRLIDAAGLKGARCGGAVISDLHANWIVNDAEACARDVLTLMARARATVAARFGVTLTPEVRWLSTASTLAEALSDVAPGA